MFFRTLVVVASFVCCSEALALQPGTIRVVDGDTIRVDGQRLRFEAIDAPETFEPRCEAEARKGQEAKRRLIVLVHRAKAVEIVRSGKADSYRRPLVTLLLDGKDAGQTLMKEGLAVPYKPGRKAWEERRQHWCPDKP